MKRPPNLRIWLSRLRSTPVRTERINEITSSLPTHLDAVAQLVSADGAALRAAFDQHATGSVTTAAAAAMGEQLDETKQRLIDVQLQVGVLRQEAAATEQRLDLMRAEQAAARHEIAAATAAIHSEAASASQATKIIGEIAAAAARDIAFERLLATIEPIESRTAGLSVIIITWNHAGWLPEALASARATLAAVPHGHAGQILILDDASTDETSQVLDALADDRQFRIIRSPSNLNLARARNVLLAACPTRHALVLDADNRALADGVAEVYGTAVALGSAITYGQVIAATADESSWATISFAPSRESLSLGHSFDSMAVIDVEAIAGLGGYAIDPQLGGWVDDLELLLRCLRRGGLLAYVPTVVGRYRLSPLRHSSRVTDQSALERRVARSHLYDDPDFDQFAIVAAHPAVGVLWASPGASEFIERADAAWQVPSFRPQPAATAAAAGPRVLIVCSGGVGNFGDDAISGAVIERVRAACPTAAIEIISDGEMPLINGPATPWAGTVVETWQGTNGLDLGAFDLAVFAGGGNLTSWFAPTLLIPRCDIARRLAEHGVPVIWSGQGIGPCTDAELDLVVAAARSARTFGCRDRLSVELVAQRVAQAAQPGEPVESGEPVEPGKLVELVELVGDDAMGLPRADDARLAAVMRRAEVTTERFVVLHVRLALYAGTASPAEFAELADAIDALAWRTGATVVGLVTNNNEPHEALVLAALAQPAPRRSPWRIIDLVDDPELARAVLAAADAVISHSYHVALWALEAGTPALLATGSAYYEAKAEGLRALAGLTASIALDAHSGIDSLDKQLDAVRSELDPAVLARAAGDVTAWWQVAVAAALSSPAR